jgi:O-antigen ligase/polysaccharide polymerase Wzy-like membrane protein
MVLGIALAGAPTPAVLGTLAALVAIAAAIYRPALGLAILALVYPFDLTTYIGPAKVTTSYALLPILFTVWLARQLLRNPPPWQKTRLDLLVAIFAGLTLLSLAGLTGNTEDQVIAQIKAAGGFVLFFLTTQSMRQRSDLWLVVGAVTVSGCAQAALTTVPVLTGTGTLALGEGAQGTLGDPNIFSGFLVLIIPLAIGLGLASGRLWMMAIAGAVLLIDCVALIATLSRSGWLGFLVSVIALLLFMPSRRKQVATGVAAVVGAVLIFGLIGPIGARLGDGLWQTFQARWDIWAGAIPMIAHHPIFGVGLANFSIFLPSYVNQDLGEVTHAHNLFLNVAAERGLFAFVALTGIVALIFLSLRKGYLAAVLLADRLMIAAVTAAFAGYFVHSLFDVSYYDYKMLLLFWLMTGVAATIPTVFGPAVARQDS